MQLSYTCSKQNNDVLEILGVLPDWIFALFWSRGLDSYLIWTPWSARCMCPISWLLAWSTPPIRMSLGWQGTSWQWGPPAAPRVSTLYSPPPLPSVMISLSVVLSDWNVRSFLGRVCGLHSSPIWSCFEVPIELRHIPVIPSSPHCTLCVFPPSSHLLSPS